MYFVFRLTIKRRKRNIRHNTAMYISGSTWRPWLSQSSGRTPFWTICIWRNCAPAVIALRDRTEAAFKDLRITILCHEQLVHESPSANGIFHEIRSGRVTLLDWMVRAFFSYFKVAKGYRNVQQRRQLLQGAAYRYNSDLAQQSCRLGSNAHG